MRFPEQENTNFLHLFAVCQSQQQLHLHHQQQCPPSLFSRVQESAFISAVNAHALGEDAINLTHKSSWRGSRQQTAG